MRDKNNKNVKYEITTSHEWRYVILLFTWYCLHNIISTSYNSVPFKASIFYTDRT